MLVRAATMRDHDGVVELMQFMHPSDPKLSENVSRSVFKEILESNGFSITVAEVSGKLAGSCYINVIPNLTRNAAPYAVIENVVTHPEFGRQEVEQALVSHTLQLAKSHGCYKVMLLTNGDPSVHRLYESCGMKSGTETAFFKRW